MNLSNIILISFTIFFYYNFIFPIHIENKTQMDVYYTLVLNGTEIMEDSVPIGAIAPNNFIEIPDIDTGSHVFYFKILNTKSKKITGYDSDLEIWAKIPDMDIEIKNILKDLKFSSDSINLVSEYFLSVKGTHIKYEKVNCEKLLYYTTLPITIKKSETDNKNIKVIIEFQRYPNHEDITFSNYKYMVARVLQ